MVVFIAAACAFTVLCMGLSLYSVSAARKRFMGDVDAKLEEAKRANVESAAKLALALEILGRADDALVEEAESNEVTQPRRVVLLRPVTT